MFTGDREVYELNNAKMMEQHGKSKSSALAVMLAWTGVGV